MRADTLERNPTTLKQPDQRRSTDPQKVGGLLRGQRLSLRCDRDCQPLAHGFDHLAKNPVDLRRQLDLLSHAGAAQHIAGGDGATTGTLVSAQEVVDVGQLCFVPLGEVGLLSHVCSTHDGTS